MCVSENHQTEIKVKHLTLNISTKCNQNCSICFGHHRLFNPDENMPLSVAQKATDLYFENRQTDYNGYSIMLFGGEPLLNFSIIPDYISWVNDKYKNLKYEINLFTNGLALNRKMVKFFLEKNVNIHLTFDTNFENYSIRNNSNKKNHRKINSIIKYAAKKNPYRIIPIYVLNNESPNQLLSFATKMKAYNIKSIFIVRELFNLWNDEDIKIVKKISFHIRNNLGIKVIVGAEATFSCTDCYPQNIMVYPDGSIYDNCLTFGCSLYNLGFVTKQDLIDTYYMGNIFSTNKLYLDYSKKRDFSHKKYPTLFNTGCHTLSENIDDIKELWSN